MKSTLRKELEKRGTADITNGVVNQVTQAIDEQSDKVKYLIFGELREQAIIPIEVACAKCDHCYFPTTTECQKHQKKDAMVRGFNRLICPQQFIK